MLATQLITFQNNTATHTKTKARGSNMTKVDDALGAYWLQILTAGAHQEILLLSGVVNACKEWLKKKYAKSEYETTIFGKSSYYNQLFLKRKAEVTRLGNEALDELYTRMQAHGIITPDAKGQIKFDRNKLNTLGSRAYDRKEIKALSPGYMPERLSYLKSGKTGAISGTGVHRTISSVHALQLNNNVNQLSNVTPKALKVVRKEIDKLTVEDFQILDTLGRANALSGDMNYLRKAERYKYMAISDGLGNLCDYNDNLITTHAYKITAYAMDGYGNLFCKNDDPLNGADFFNHSSFNAGKDVICAGTIVIHNGVLQSIDNNSGHYQPGRDHLFTCIDVLVSEGVDITHAIVNLYIKHLGNLQEHRYNATTFHANRNAPADIHVI